MSSDFHPRSSLGQNFLVDRRILSRTIETAHITDRDVILEIGPGKGILTAELLGSPCSRLYSLEIDRRLETFLQPLTENWKKLTLIWADAMRFDYSTLPLIPNKAIANIPYNITTPLIWRLLEQLAPKGLRYFLFMVQKEAADRICAPPSTKERYPLGITIEVMGKAKIITKVPPSAFRPQPDVNSALLEVIVNKNFLLPSDVLWRNMLRTGFAQRRKKLINNLKASGLEKNFIERCFDQCKIGLTARAEELSAVNWLELHEIIKKERPE